MATSAGSSARIPRGGTPSALPDPQHVGEGFARLAHAACDVTTPQQFFVWQQTHLAAFVPHLAWAWWRPARPTQPEQTWLHHCVPLNAQMREQLHQPGSRWWQQARAQSLGGDDVAWLALDAASVLPPGTDAHAPHGVWLATVADADAAPPSIHALFTRAGSAPPHEAHLLRWALPILQHCALRAHRLAVPPRRTRPMPLTPRELAVLRAVREAGHTSDAAALLDIRPATVKNHLRTIMRKLGAATRGQAIARAMDNGWLV